MTFLIKVKYVISKKLISRVKYNFMLRFGPKMMGNDVFYPEKVKYYLLDSPVLRKSSFYVFSDNLVRK